VKKEMDCQLGWCPKLLRGRQKRYCSQSHKTLAYNGRREERINRESREAAELAARLKEERARESRLLYRFDSLTAKERQALFLSVVRSLNLRHPNMLEPPVSQAPSHPIR